MVPGLKKYFRRCWRKVGGDQKGLHSIFVRVKGANGELLGVVQTLLFSGHII